MHAPDAILAIDARGIVLSWNQAAEKLFGYTEAQARGRPLEALIGIGDRGQTAAQSAVGGSRWEAACRRADGSLVDVELAVAPVLDERGHPVAASVIARDITERRQLEGALRRRAEALAVADRAKDEFLAVVSHELRTPLNAILGWSRLLEEGRLDSTGQAQAIETIVRNAKTQTQLVDDLLDMSRIDAGVLRVEHQGAADGADIYLVEAARDRDVRGPIAQLVAERRWGLRELHQMGMSLEEVFLRVVAGEEFAGER